MENLKSNTPYILSLVHGSGSKLPVLTYPERSTERSTELTPKSHAEVLSKGRGNGYAIYASVY